MVKEVKPIPQIAEVPKAVDVIFYEDYFGVILLDDDTEVEFTQDQFAEYLDLSYDRINQCYVQDATTRCYSGDCDRETYQDKADFEQLANDFPIGECQDLYQFLK